MLCVEVVLDERCNVGVVPKVARRGRRRGSQRHPHYAVFGR
jgi:hypothetical protein